MSLRGIRMQEQKKVETALAFVCAMGPICGKRLIAGSFYHEDLAIRW